LDFWIIFGCFHNFFLYSCVIEIDFIFIFNHYYVFILKIDYIIFSQENYIRGQPGEIKTSVFCQNNGFQNNILKVKLFKQRKSNQSFCTYLQWQYNSLFFFYSSYQKKHGMKKKTKYSNKSYAHNKQQMCSND
jgi:hypothetical protein